MTDFGAQFASSFETASQSRTDALEERLQRVHSMEQVRQERIGPREPPQPERDTNVRLSVRERIVQQTQSQRPSAQRRARHPRRSASFHTGDTNVLIANDIQNFREMFEASRSNLFGRRTAASNENVAGFQAGQRTVDLSGSEQESQPTSGSSSPRVSRRGVSESGGGLQDAFASVVANLSFNRGSDSNLSDSGREYGSRSSSATREGRSNSSTNNQRFLMTNTADLILTARNGRNEARRSRMAERRRQTIGVTPSDVREAIALTSGGSRHSDNQNNVLQTRTANTDNTGLSRDSFQYSSYRPKQKIEINENTTRPVLALNDETVVYVDEKGHCHWLEKNHPLLKAAKENTAPSVVIKYKTDSPAYNETPTDSVTDIPGDPEERYKKVRELIMKSKSREGFCGNGEFEQISNSENDHQDGNESEALDETDSNAKKMQKIGINPAYTIEAIEERFKHVSYYTKPRARPSLDSYKLTRKCKSIYDHESNGQTESTREERRAVSQQESVSTSTESRRQNGYHVVVTDTADTDTAMNTVETVTETREQINPYGALNRSNSGPSNISNLGYVNRSALGTSSESTLLRRSASVQESRPRSTEFGETSTARLVRHGSLESTTTRFNRQVPAQDDIHEEVESIISRLQQRHAYAEIPIDTSHLDIEEMRMIQKALEENPSPPPSPVDFEMAEVTDDTIANFVQNDTGNHSEISVVTDVILEPVSVVTGDEDDENSNEFSPLSPVQEDNESETGTPGPNSNTTDSVDTVFDEFVSTVNNEHTLNLPRGYIFQNR